LPFRATKTLDALRTKHHTPYLRAKFKGKWMLATSSGVGSATDEPVQRELPASHVLAVVVGNAITCYDFATYAFFAAQIGRAFFSAQSPVIPRNILNEPSSQLGQRFGC
jgi:hypothetical protein